MNLILLGASGSIGTQTLSCLENFKNKWTLVGFSVGNKAFLIDSILEKFNKIKYICVKNKKDYLSYKKKYPNIKFFYGNKGLVKLVNADKRSAVVNALVSYIGLKPSIVTLKRNRILLLANKESLVIGGSLLKKLVSKHKGRIIPIDSEHSAISKCLLFSDTNEVDSITITASGGPFFNLTKEELKNVKLEDALKHPNWSMGKKITIDSATMMNKVFEVIEAHYLFNYPYEKINVMIDRISHTHGFIKLKNNDYIVNNSNPSMISSINFALNMNSCNVNENQDDIYKVKSLEQFNLLPFDYNRFDLMKYAKFVIDHKGNSGAIFCTINDTLVNSFINKRITYVELLENIDKIMSSVKFSKCGNYLSLILTIKYTKKRILKYIQRSK